MSAFAAKCQFVQGKVCGFRAVPLADLLCQREVRDGYR